MQKQRPICSVPEFYSHALAIEREAAERYGEFREYFDDRGEEVLAGLCANLCRVEEQHYNDLARASEGLDLPPIPADGFQHRMEPPAGGGQLTGPAAGTAPAA